MPRRTHYRDFFCGAHCAGPSFEGPGKAQKGEKFYFQEGITEKEGENVSIPGQIGESGGGRRAPRLLSDYRQKSCWPFGGSWRLDGIRNLSDYLYPRNQAKHGCFATFFHRNL